MKLLTWNIWKGTHFEKVIGELRQHDADILCLQEVKKDSANQAEEIAEKLGYSFVLQQVFTTDRHTPTFTQCNAILAKSKITEVQKIMLSEMEDYHRDSTSEPRGALKATIGGLSVICTHLGFSSDLSVTNLQKKQLNNLLPFVEHDKCVLAGDFNSIPESEIIQRMEEKMRNTDTSNSPTRTSRKEGESEARIDYIFVSREIKFHNFKIHPTTASDHNILTVELTS